MGKVLYNCIDFAIILVILTIISNRSVSAPIVAVEVTGVVNSIETAGYELDGSVGIGSGITGYCIYDLDTPDQDPDEEYGYYSLISISMSIGDYTFMHNPASIDLPLFVVSTGVSNGDHIYSAYSLEPCFDGTILGDGLPLTYDDIVWGWTYLELMNLWTSSGEYILTDALPSSFPDISAFDIRKKFETRFYDESYNKYFEIKGELTSLTETPEPGMVFLLGLGGLVLIRKRN